MKELVKSYDLSLKPKFSKQSSFIHSFIPAMQLFLYLAFGKLEETIMILLQYKEGNGNANSLRRQQHHFECVCTSLSKRAGRSLNTTAVQGISPVNSVKTSGSQFCVRQDGLCVP